MMEAMDLRSGETVRVRLGRCPYDSGTYPLYSLTPPLNGVVGRVPPGALGWVIDVPDRGVFTEVIFASGLVGAINSRDLEALG
jgi:hypothetical protein